ncbi:hypothetical protein DFH27DRAFT_521203 [Peziza echinospora]|nr:hypothetical protein DFH27DRAFT_521203 [Peziza echinospora]
MTQPLLLEIEESSVARDGVGISASGLQKVGKEVGYTALQVKIPTPRRVGIYPQSPAPPQPQFPIDIPNLLLPSPSPLDVHPIQPTMMMANHRVLNRRCGKPNLPNLPRTADECAVAPACMAWHGMGMGGHGWGGIERFVQACKVVCKASIIHCHLHHDELGPELSHDSQHCSREAAQQAECLNQSNSAGFIERTNERRRRLVLNSKQSKLPCSCPAGHTKPEKKSLDGPS